LSYSMLARVLLLPLPLVLPGLLSGSLDEFLLGCLSPVPPAELLRELRLPSALVITGPHLRCQRLRCHGLASAIMRLASPCSVLGSGLA